MSIKFGLALAIAAVVAAVSLLLPGRDKTPIRVGVLHSLTGAMAISERPVVDATLLAIEQINQAGGLLGRRVEAVVADGKSDPATFAREAERLIVDEKVSVLFGCWTSACRKAVRAVVEKHNHLLFYPVQYEGLEESPNIVYTGATPNQQIIPAVGWALRHLGSRYYLLGSDYVFPRVANWLMRREIAILGGSVVGERYLPLGATRMDAVVRDVRELKPDAILNTVNGDSNLALFDALKKAGIDAATMPVMSFSFGENELAAMRSPQPATGHYAAWNYFQSIDDPRNRAFIDAFRRKYGSKRVLSDPVESAWLGVRIWASAVASVGSDDVRMVLGAVRHRSLRAPEGIVSVDHTTQHLWKTVRIGQITPGGQFRIRWSSGVAVRPVPFPTLATRYEAAQFLESLRQRWHGGWAAPGAARAQQR